MADTKKPAPSEVTAQKAYEALVSGQTKSAIKLYSEAIESRSLATESLARALLNRALAYQNSGSYDQAVDDYSAAMRLDALSAKMRAVALYNRGLANQKRGKPALAIEDFTNALFLDVEFSQAYYGRGNALRDSGQYLFALSDYDKALRYKHPEPYLPMYGKALVYEALKRPENARKMLMAILEIKPDFAPAQQKLTSLQDPTSKSSGVETPPGSDDITTASLDKAKPDLVIVKTDLPDPVRPPASLNAERPAKIVARLPQSDEKTTFPVIKAKATTSATAPATAAAAATATDPTATASITPAAATAETVATPKGWMVQVSSQRDEDRAWDVWKKLEKRHAALLDGQEAVVVKADLGADKGIFYRLRINALESADAAKSLCNRLKRAGTNCFVSRAQG